MLGVSSDEPSQSTEIARGVVNGISIGESGEKGKEVLHVAIALGKEMRLGRWITVPGKNGAVLFRIEKQEKKTAEVAGDEAAGLMIMSTGA